jgi:hypothetical protein
MHKVSTVSSLLLSRRDQDFADSLGPLRTPWLGRGPSLLELLLPQPHLANPRSPLCRKLDRRQVLRASSVVVNVVYRRHQGLSPSLRDRSGCCAARDLSSGSCRDSHKKRAY